MSRILQRGGFLYTALAILFAGCQDTGESSRQTAGSAAPAVSAPERQFPEVAWDTIFSIGGGVQDTLLLRPRLVAAGNGYLYAYDYVDARLKAFDGKGNLQWIFGRQGKGPGEFGNATGLQIGPQGSIWVVDSPTARITEVTPDGELSRMVPFDGKLILRVLPLAENMLLIPADPHHFWIAVDDSGRVTDQGFLPLPELKTAHPATRTPFVAVSPSHERWAAVFPWASPLLVYDGKALRCAGTLVEGGPFPPAPSPDNVIWAVGLAMSDTSVFVLARGQTRDERRIIDEYSTNDCRYLRTLRLPGLFQAMAYNRGTFYLYREEPAPSIIALRPRLM